MIRRRDGAPYMRLRVAPLCALWLHTPEETFSLAYSLSCVHSHLPTLASARSSVTLLVRLSRTFRYLGEFLNLRRSPSFMCSLAHSLVSVVSDDGVCSPLRYLACVLLAFRGEAERRE